MKKKYDFSKLGLEPIKFSLTAKLTLIMLLSCLIPLLIYWAISLKTSVDRIENDSILLMRETAVGLTNQADEWIDKNVRVIKTAARLDDIISMNRSRQEPVLEAIHEEYPWIYLAFTLDIDGMNIARSDGKSLKDYSDRSYYQEVLEGNLLSWQTLIGKTSGKPALVLAVPIMSNEIMIGVMAAAMTIDDISSRIVKWRKGVTGFAFLVDDKGKVVAHPQEEFVQEQRILDDNQAVATFLTGETNTSIEFKDNNDRASLGYIQKTTYGWGLIIQQEKDEIYAPVRTVIIIAIVLLIITFFVILIIASLAARSVVTPIKDLTYAANEMSMGNLKIDVKLNRKDELGYLAHSIDRMQSSLNMAINRLKGRKTEK